MWNSNTRSLEEWGKWFFKMAQDHKGYFYLAEFKLKVYIQVPVMQKLLVYNTN